MPVTAENAPNVRGLLLRYLDVAVVVVAAIPALALNAPALGYIVGAGTWIVQRLFQGVDSRYIKGRFEDPVRLAGVTLAEAFGRIWLLIAAIVISALVGNHSDGLTCAVVVFAAYTISFVIRLVDGTAQAAARAAAQSAGAPSPSPETK